MMGKFAKVLFASLAVFAMTSLAPAGSAIAAGKQAQPSMSMAAVAPSGHGVQDHSGRGAKMQNMHDMQNMRNAPASVHVVHMAGELRVVAHDTIILSLLTALAIHQEDNLEYLGRARKRFTTILDAFHIGDESLGLPKTTNPKIVKRLAEVDRRWSEFDRVIERILKTRRVRVDQVERISILSEPLLRAIGRLVDSFEYYAFDGRAFSVLTGTVKVAEAQQSILKEMIMEYLLIAYGHEPERNRERLAASLSRYNRALQGLVKGDSELRVLPPPSKQLDEQYRVIHRLWTQFSPVIEAAGKASGDADAALILKIALRGLQLADAMDEAVLLYHKL